MSFIVVTKHRLLIIVGKVTSLFWARRDVGMLGGATDTLVFTESAPPVSSQTCDQAGSQAASWGEGTAWDM